MTGNPTVRPQLWWITRNKGMICKTIEDFLVLYHNIIFWGSFSTGTLWFNKLLNWLNWWESFFLVLPNETANKRVERTRGSGTTSLTHYFQQPHDAHFPSVTLFFQSLVHFDPVRSCATQVVCSGCYRFWACGWDPPPTPWQMLSYACPSKSSFTPAGWGFAVWRVWLNEAFLVLSVEDFMTPQVTHKHIRTTQVAVVSSRH